MQRAASTLSRRFFLRRLALTAGLWGGVAPGLLAASRERFRLRLALIGCGGAGAASLGLAASERVVALADVDERKLAVGYRVASSFGQQPRVFHDYRRMLEACQAEVEAVIISTPDHHHAPAAMRAMALGKHVLVQKPLAHNLKEARALRLAARRQMVVTQMGNQGHTGDGYRLLCEHLWSGAIGALRETHSLMERELPEVEVAAPAPAPVWLHWEEWLGPAERRPYRAGLHPAHWRGWTDFGTGVLGDMGCHVLDGVFWALKLWQAPAYTVECLAQTPADGPGRYPRQNVVCWRIPARENTSAVKVYAYDTEWPPWVRELERRYGEKFRGGTLYVGEKGMMFTGPTGEGPRFLPPSENEAQPRPPKQLERSGKTVFREFLDACRGRPPAGMNFELAGPLTEFVLTGVLACRAGPGQVIEWDAENLRVMGRPELAGWVGRSYRTGWEI